MIVIFGHQSVGANILDGIRDLAATGVPAPRILPMEALAASTGGDVIAPFRVGRNRDPQAKLDHFTAVACAESGLQAQAALFKFCYADIDAATDVVALFDAYQATVEHIRAARPRLVIAHVTVPLRTVPSSPIDRLRRLLGQVDRRIVANAARDAFNQKLRVLHASGGRLFDLAAIESRAGTAKPSMVRSGKPVPTLAREYSSDGGHLNARGREVVARAFLEFLDRLAARAGPMDGAEPRRFS